MIYFTAYYSKGKNQYAYHSLASQGDSRMMTVTLWGGGD